MTTNITKDVSPYTKLVKPQIKANLDAAHIDTSKSTASVEVMQIARKTIDDFVKANGNIAPSVATALLERALTELSGEMQGQVADLIHTHGGPTTLLERSQEIRDNVNAVLAKANTA